MSPHAVVVGRIVKPHGIRGEVVVEPFSDRTERFAAGGALVAGNRRLVVAASRPHKGRLLVTFESVVDRTQAERLRGRELVAHEDLAETDSYLVSELVGLPVEDESGHGLGSVAAVVQLPAAADYDLLEIDRHDGTTWLLPAVDEYVQMRETDDGELVVTVVSPPAGLVDGDEAGA